MNNKFKQPQLQAGFTLGELGLVLLIVAIIAMFAYPKFMEYRDGVLAGEEADNIIRYASKTKSAYSMDPDFTGVTTASLIGTGVFPAAMLQGTTVINNYKGNVTAEPNAAKDAVIFSSTNYTQAACREVAQRIASVADTIKVGSTAVKASSASLDKSQLSACVAGVTLQFAVTK